MGAAGTNMSDGDRKKKLDESLNGHKCLFCWLSQQIRSFENDLKLEINEFVTFSNYMQSLTVSLERSNKAEVRIKTERCIWTSV